MNADVSLSCTCFVFSDGIVTKIVKVYLQKYKHWLVTSICGAVCAIKVIRRWQWCPLLAEYSSAIFYDNTSGLFYQCKQLRVFYALLWFMCTSCPSWNVFSSTPLPSPPSLSLSEKHMVNRMYGECDVMWCRYGWLHLATWCGRPACGGRLTRPGQ